MFRITTQLQPAEAEEATSFYEDIAGSLGCCGRRNKPTEFGCEGTLTRPKIPDNFRECILNKTTSEIQRAAWRIQQVRVCQDLTLSLEFRRRVVLVQLIFSF